MQARSSGETWVVKPAVTHLLHTCYQKCSQFIWALPLNLWSPNHPQQYSIFKEKKRINGINKNTQQWQKYPTFSFFTNSTAVVQMVFCILHYLFQYFFFWCQKKQFRTCSFSFILTTRYSDQARMKQLNKFQVVWGKLTLSAGRHNARRLTGDREKKRRKGKTTSWMTPQPKQNELAFCQSENDCEFYTKSIQSSTI